jgi:hypothetical protein
VPHIDFLIRVAFDEDPHVVVRAFAAHAILTLVNCGVASVDQITRNRLETINDSPYPREISKRYQRGKRNRPEKEVSTRFHFDMDMGRYWFEPLGSCFALPQSALEVLADELIVDEWRHNDITGWEKDERLRRGVFGDGETYLSHSSYPRADGLRFYLSYHAMMVVAGRLLASNSLHQDPEDVEDEFKSWLQSHALARSDWRWLSDRRDDDPLERADWKDAKREDDWPWSVQKRDFDRVLRIGTNTLTVWGDWTDVADYRLEAIEVRSALVTTDKSEALLRALQTTNSPHDY